MFKLGALGVFARGFVGEGLVQIQPFELADLVLVERTDPQVATSWPFPALFLATVRLGSLAFAMHRQNTLKPSLFRRFSVRLVVS